MNAGTGLTGNELYPRFSDAEYDRRYHAVREAMRQDNLDAILVSGARGSSEVHYLSNYLAQSPCWLLFPREGAPTVFIHFFNHQPCAKAQSITNDVRWYGPAPIPTLADAIRQRNLAKSRIGLVSMRGMAYGHVTQLQRLFPEAEFVEFGPAFGRIRRVRSDEELGYLRRSGYLTDLACEALEEHLRPGLTEHDILSIVYNSYIKNGGEPGIHFIATTRMDQPDRFVPWQKPTPRVIEAGSVVITELTVSYWGYSTQIHRPFAITREPPPLYRKLFDTALECMKTSARSVNLGRPAKHLSPQAPSSKRTALAPTTASSMVKQENLPSSAHLLRPTLWSRGHWSKTWSTSSNPTRSPAISKPACNSAPPSSLNQTAENRCIITRSSFPFAVKSQLNKERK